MKVTGRVVLVFGLASAGVTHAETPADFTAAFAAEARQEDKAFTGFSARRGAELYQRCSTCHAKDPRDSGKTRAGKEIESMAPRVNAKRFTNPAHVAKWFTRNCEDVLKRACTAREKGDFLAFLLSQ